MRMRPLGDVCRRAACPAAYTIAFAAVCMVAACLSGCATTSPRFRAGYPVDRAAGVPRTKELSGTRAVKVRPWEDEPLPGAAEQGPSSARDRIAPRRPVRIRREPDRSGMDCSAFTEVMRTAEATSRRDIPAFHRCPVPGRVGDRSATVSASAISCFSTPRENPLPTSASTSKTISLPTPAFHTA
jgi:hypothetical protein